MTVRKGIGVTVTSTGRGGTGVGSCAAGLLCRALGGLIAVLDGATVSVTDAPVLGGDVDFAVARPAGTGAVVVSLRAVVSDFEGERS